MKQYALKIREYRKAAGMNRAELARAMGVSFTTVNRWETGEDFPAGARLPDLADVLRCTIDQLYGRVPPGREEA